MRASTHANLRAWRVSACGGRETLGVSEHANCEGLRASGHAGRKASRGLLKALRASGRRNRGALRASVLLSDHAASHAGVRASSSLPQSSEHAQLTTHTHTRSDANSAPNTPCATHAPQHTPHTMPSWVSLFALMVGTATRRRGAPPGGCANH